MCVNVFIVGFSESQPFDGMATSTCCYKVRDPKG